MNIKKINAILSLLVRIMLLIHIVFQTAVHIMFLYMPVMSRILGYAVLVPAVLHGILSMLSVLFLHDTAKVIYRKANARTCIQRVSGITAAALFPIHIYSFSLHRMTAGSAVFYVTLGVQILFYTSIILHEAVSFSKALITLGILESDKKMHVTDRIIYAVCVFLLTVVSIVVTGTKMTIFGM